MTKIDSSAKPIENEILISGARTHNLKNVSLQLPRNKLIVVTGVSGSGKSSLTIDTLFAEGQRRYVESLSSYARQFMSRMNKPDVDFITGIGPAIAIQQKVITRTTRSTVGTLTEIYDYLRLLFGRIGVTYSPISGKKVRKDEVGDVVDYVNSFEDGQRAQLFVKLQVREDRSIFDELNLLIQKGFSRIRTSKETKRIEDVLEGETKVKINKLKNIEIVIDRFSIRKNDEENTNRISDSIQTAFFESEGECYIEVEGEKAKHFSNKFELDGLQFDEPSPHFFNYNNPYGACKTCEGFGSVIGIDPNSVIPDKSLSIHEGAIAPWRGVKMKTWNQQIIKAANELNFPIHKPIMDLTQAQIDLLWEGSKGHFKGLNKFFKYLQEKTYKIQYRVMLSRYRGRTTCPDCKGTRLRKDAANVKISKHSIIDLVLMQVKDLQQFFKKIKLDKYQKEVASRILIEINNRLGFMMDVGLGYLTLNRLSNTLSGGETQRINLTRTLGSNLTSSLYVLDEPSIGLHPMDTKRLIKVLKSLRDLGNTVVVVEHDEDIIKAVDHIVDMGPLAGSNGGEVIFEGDHKAIIKSKTSLTGKYLTGKLKVEVPKRRRKFSNRLKLKGVQEHNLKNFDITIPLNAMTVVTGMSGSGKTTLIKKILYPAMKFQLDGYGDKPGKHKELSGDVKRIANIEMIDQNPLGRSSRSNPVTYIGAYDAIRKLFSDHQLSKMRGYKPKHFSFNVDGGRCEECKGEGETVVEMQFLADVHLVCESCKGARFKQEILEVTIEGKGISDILEMTVDDAITFFESYTSVQKQIKPLADVGLGYIKLGQSSSTLSGGEAQRVKLASYLGKGQGVEPILFIFDEPTTGLHFHDINKLLSAFNQLIEKGHSIVIIEHNMEVIKSADWIIDLGPEGGDQGGTLLFEGLPEDLVKVKDSHTGKFLKEYL